MVLPADTTGTRPVTLIQASAPANAIGNAKQETLDRLNQLTLGKDYQAQVLTRLSNGSFLVKVADTPVNMALPQGTKAGDVLNLTLLANQPRATFLLAQNNTNSTATLSNAGRLISHLLQQAQQGGASTHIIAKAPLTTIAGATPQQIASAMKNAIAFSGVFYESHVAQWAIGKRPISDLLNEPLAKRGYLPTNTTGSATANSKTELGNLVNNFRAWAADRTLPESLRAVQANQNLADAVNPVTSKQQDMPVTEGTRLLNMQLETLEQRRIVWQGELFPGQPMEWEIVDDTPQHESKQQEPQSTWQSTVRFSLPSLGAVSATIRLNGEHVQVQVSTNQAETVDALNQHRKLLADALDAAGTKLDALTIKQDG
tara:strand:- start:202527 stop:203642 length:1116 start_codon:yes stop_codon:yes gene_type:complete